MDGEGGSDVTGHDRKKKTFRNLLHRFYLNNNFLIKMKDNKMKKKTIKNT